MTRLLPALLLAAGCAPKPGDGAVCAPGGQRCFENAYQQCADDGSGWATVAECGAQDLVCVTGEGCSACFPDNRTCDGLDVMRCRPDGSGLDLIATCGEFGSRFGSMRIGDVTVETLPAASLASISMAVSTGDPTGGTGRFQR